MSDHKIYILYEQKIKRPNNSIEIDDFNGSWKPLHKEENK